MTPWLRRLLAAAAAAVLLLGLLAATGALVARSRWFHDKVRERIIAEVEGATRGEAEIASFTFDWHSMEARIEGFVLRGREPKDGPPLVRAASVVVGLRVISAFRRDVNIALLRVNRPEVYLVRDEDGNLNTPSPVEGRQTRDPITPLLRLAIQRFDVTDGVVRYDEQAYPFSAVGEDLRADAVFEARGPRYSGQLTARQILLPTVDQFPADLSAEINWAVEGGRIVFSPARISTEHSRIEVDGAVENLGSPEWSGEVSGEVAVADMAGPLRLPLASGGSFEFSGSGRHAASGSSFTGRVIASGLGYRRGRFAARPVSGSAEVTADQDSIQLREVAISALGGEFRGEARMAGGDGFQARGLVSGLDTQRLAASVGEPALPWTGVVSGSITVSGTTEREAAWKVGAQLRLESRPGEHPVAGELAFEFDQAADVLTFEPSWVQSNTTRIEFSGPLRQNLDLALETANLDDLLPALALVEKAPTSLPVRLSDGTARLEGQLSGLPDNPRFQGQVVGGPLTWDGHRTERVASGVEVDESRLRLTNLSLQHRRARLRGDGEIALENWQTAGESEIAGEFTVTGAEVRELLDEVGRDWPAEGTLSAAARIQGTLRRPELLARLHVESPVLQGETFDAMEAEVRYTENTLSVDSGRLQTARGDLGFQASYQHSPEDWDTGELRFTTAATGLPLSQWRRIRELHEGLDATMAWNFSGTVDFGNPETRLASLAGEVALENLRFEERPLGDVRLTASNRRNIVIVQGTAGLSDATIQARAEWSLVGDSFGLGQITFSNLTLDSLRTIGLFGGGDAQAYVNGTLDGEIGFTGPILEPGSWRGMARLNRLEIKPARDSEDSRERDLTLRNAEPLVFAIDNREITVETARLVSPDTDLAVSGVLSFRRRNPWNLRLRGNMDLAVLSAVKRDLLASGASAIDVVVRGSLLTPQINGRLEFENASFYLQDLPNGLDQVNGAIIFDRTRATFERFSSRTGGGNLELAGFILFGGDELVYRLHTEAERVRVRYPPGVSTVLDASLDFTGTSTRSMLSGEVTVTRAAINPNTDIGSVLAETTRSAAPADVTNPFLRGMGFDIRVLTAGGAEFMTSLTQDIEMEADLRVRGGPARPIVIGRVAVNRGEIVFFGNKYTIAQGEVRFFNPAKIEPVISMDLETRVRGYTVMINFTGPMDKLSFSYRSDPPLQSREIIALLTVGRAPNTTRATVENQTASPSQQSFLETGGNTLLGQALAAPVSDRLQRFFGVSRIKIDPQLTGVENTPETRITIEQQISRDITLTYVTNLARTQQQIVRVEWNFHRDWSAYAVRDSNGVFGVDFVYRRRF